MNILNNLHQKGLLLIVLLFAVQVSTFAQQDSVSTANEATQSNDSINRDDPNFVTASICIADPTDWRDDYMGVLGHAFIRLQCPTFGLDVCFSYESESANEEQMRFYTGDLHMGMVCIPTKEYIQPYKRWNRSVHEYILNLPPSAKTELWRIMDETCAQGMNFPLDLMERGCTQTLVQFIEGSLGTTSIEYGEWPDEFKLSRREIINNKMSDFPWMKFLFLDMLFDNDFNADIDNESKIIYPQQLADVWRKATVDGKPLAVYKDDLVKGSKTPVGKTYFTPMMMAIILLLISIGCLFTNKDYFNWVMLGLQFIVGLVLCALLLFSNLPGTKGANLIPLYCPIILLIWHWRKYWDKLYIVILAAWIIAVLLIPAIYVDKTHVVIGLAYIIMISKPYIRKKLLKRNG